MNQKNVINPTDREVLIILERTQPHLSIPQLALVKQATTRPYCLISAPGGLDGIACLVCDTTPISYNRNDIDQKYCAKGHHFFDTPRDLTAEEHQQRHVALHQAVDELLADYITHNPGQSILTIPLLELLAWSAQQTRHPTGNARPEQPPDPTQYFTQLINSPHFPFDATIHYQTNTVNPMLVWRDPGKPEYGPGNQTVLAWGLTKAALCLIFPLEAEEETEKSEDKNEE